MELMELDKRLGQHTKVMILMVVRFSEYCVC